MLCSATEQTPPKIQRKSRDRQGIYISVSISVSLSATHLHPPPSLSRQIQHPNPPIKQKQLSLSSPPTQKEKRKKSRTKDIQQYINLLTFPCLLSQCSSPTQSPESRNSSPSPSNPATIYRSPSNTLRSHLEDMVPHSRDSNSGF